VLTRTTRLWWSIRDASLQPSMCARFSALLATTLLLTTAGVCESSPPVKSQPADALFVLPCQDVIGSETAPRSDESIVLDRVALPTVKALQVHPTHGSDPAAWLFAKNGLLIRRDASFDLIVPDDWRGRFAVRFGSPGQLTRDLRVPGCRPTHTLNPIRESDDWLAYAGGYFVKDPACIALVVMAGQQTQTVRIGVGASCPGQAPPPTA